MSLYEDESIKGIFLLILAIAGNFIAETLSCKTQKLLRENMLAKHTISIIILYFALDFTAGLSKKPQNPLKAMLMTLIIYILFILFTKMDLNFTVVTFFLLAVIYILNNFKQYYKEKDEKDKVVKYLEISKNYISGILFGIIFIGFGTYFIKQRKEHTKDWSTYKFIFGATKCD